MSQGQAWGIAISRVCPSALLTEMVWTSGDLVYTTSLNWGSVSRARSGRV